MLARIFLDELVPATSSYGVRHRFTAHALVFSWEFSLRNKEKRKKEKIVREREREREEHAKIEAIIHDIT